MLPVVLRALDPRGRGLPATLSSPERTAAPRNEISGGRAAPQSLALEFRRVAGQRPRQSSTTRTALARHSRVPESYRARTPAILHNSLGSLVRRSRAGSAGYLPAHSALRAPVPRRARVT